MNDPATLENILKQGAEQAQPIAAVTLQHVKDVIGLG
jgi:hypothetical protein